MLARVARLGLLAALAVVAIAAPAEAFGRRHSVCYTTPIYCPPCPPCHCCWPPDETPLDPLPNHPVPHTTLPHDLTLKNDSPWQAFVIIYIRHPDCVYRVYDKKLLPPNSSVGLDPKRYFAGDHLLIETWTRKAPTDPKIPIDAWHCRCGHLITLAGGSGTFDVIGCDYKHQ